MIYFFLHVGMQCLMIYFLTGPAAEVASSWAAAYFANRDVSFLLDHDFEHLGQEWTSKSENRLKTDLDIHPIKY